MPDHVIVTDVSNVSKAYAVLGGFIVIYGLGSYVAKDRLYMSEPLIAITVGIITGPYVLGWIDPLSWGTSDETNYVTYELSRLVVGVQVLFTGITLPKAYLRKEAISLFVLLFGVMSIAWFVSALLIWGLIPDLSFLECLAISAAITPTDPVLANSITKGRYAERYVPINLRQIIVAESGANDGLGFPFLFLALYLIARTGEDRGTSIGTEVGRWVYGVLLYRILLSCVYGALVGVLAHKTLKWAETRGYIDRDNFFAYGFGLALFVLGTTGLFNSDDILACFVAGNAFTWKDWYRVRTQEEEEDSFQDIIDSLLNAAIFIYIGAIIPWGDYNTGSTALNIEPWRIVVLGITILVLRRLPWVVALAKAVPAIANLKEALFAGWFGPIGVGAVFYIQVALREIPDDGTRDRLRAVYTPVVLFCVFSSVLVHGVTVPLAKLGPNIASFSQRRTISFTARHTKETVVSSTNDVAVTATQKIVWNPLHALADGVVSVVLFWRKESFWRRENEHQRQRRTANVLRGDNISRPVKATRMKSMEMTSHTDGEPQVRSNLDGSDRDHSSDSHHSQTTPSPPPPQHEKSSVDGHDATVSPQIPAPTADIKDKYDARRPAGKASTETETLFAHVQHALEREMQRERDEAMHEVQDARSAGQPTPQFSKTTDQPSATAASVPGTPGGSRVRFN